MHDDDHDACLCAQRAFHIEVVRTELAYFPFTEANMRFRAASITSERSEKAFQAADDALITQVTVFQSCAEITRTLTVACAEAQAGLCDQAAGCA
jgi:hypothetical protein